MCTNMLYRPWDPCVDHTQQPRYQPVVGCIYWYVLGSFNDWNIIQFNNKTTSSEEFYEVHKIVLDGQNANMASLVQTRKYGAINAEDPTALRYYVMNYVSDNFALQEDITMDGRVSKSGELIVWSEYLS